MIQWNWCLSLLEQKVTNSYNCNKGLDTKALLWYDEGLTKREGETHSPSQEVGRTEETHKDQKKSKWLQIVTDTIDVLTDKVLGVIMYSQSKR